MIQKNKKKKMHSRNSQLGRKDMYLYSAILSDASGTASPGARPRIAVRTRIIPIDFAAVE